jgi:hypothetical protein
LPILNDENFINKIWHRACSREVIKQKRRREMHFLQKELLDDFKEKFKNFTLKQYAELTGIERTRVFRLFNGQEMKLGEWDLIRKLTYGEKASSITFGQNLNRKKREELLESVKRFVGLQELKYQLA